MQEVIAHQRQGMSPRIRWLLAVAIIAIMCVVLSGFHSNRPATPWDRVLDISPDLRLTKVLADDNVAVTFPEGCGVQLAPREAGCRTTIALLLAPISSSREGQQRRLIVVCRLLSQQPGSEADIVIQQLRGKTVLEKYCPLLPPGKWMEDGGVVGNEFSKPVAIGSKLSAVEFQSMLHPEAEEVQVFLGVQATQETSTVSLQSISIQLAEEDE